ncbi:HNH endonuclease signature motif containing protein [Luteipulveratus mongoliensis]|uniref:HNH endonuclease signature motif containing protein n=1 Tax=Luteipulveratus mongoliensis TaxID=571913 RepID=UPI000697CABD|nr:HNH endonuclease signature motif containing protein [Luteipulveratus mongoliensis]
MDAAALLRDPDTGLLDSTRALELCREVAQAVYSQAKTDRHHRQAADLQADIEASQALINAVTAVQLMRIAQYAATVEHVDPVTGEVSEVAHPLGHAAEFADVDLAPGLAWSPRQATARVEEAIDAVTKTPGLVDEMAAGHLDGLRVARVTRELLEAPEPVCAQVEQALLARGVQGWSARQVQMRTRRLVQQTDPAAARSSRVRRATERIGVFLEPGPETGLTDLHATLPTEQAIHAYAAVDELARELHRANRTSKTLGQCRADALTDLVLQRAEVTASFTVAVPVVPAVPASAREAGPADAACGAVCSDPWAQGLEPEPPAADTSTDDLDDDAWDVALAELIARDPGPAPDPPPDDPWWDLMDDLSSEDAEHHPVPAVNSHSTSPELAHAVRDACGAATTADAVGAVGIPGVGDVEIPGVGVIAAATAQALMRTLGARLTRTLIDPRTGTLLETAAQTYRPTAAIRRLVQQRDQHCRFPGCSHPARYCETDHVIPWPTGATRPTNLLTLCKHHHRAKHEAGWRVTMANDGTCTWTSPHGREHTTRPPTFELVRMGTPSP